MAAPPTDEKLVITTTLIVLCVIYTIAAANEYWLLNWLKCEFDISLSIFAALLQGASWPIQAIFYSIERSKLSTPRVITHSMYRSYLVLGLLSAVITLTRTMGIVSLPPTIYAIIANTEIVFETMMTRIILKRTISKLQMLAVALVIAGVMVSLYDPHTGKYGEEENVSQHALVSGIILSLASRFTSSLNTILADRFVVFAPQFRKSNLKQALALIGFLVKMLNREWVCWNALLPMLLFLSL
jgi:drug/metabolite transporter (DMT)-like permease